MPFTEEEGGLINNFAPETKTYHAEPPTKSPTAKLHFAGYGSAGTDWRLAVRGLLSI
jgi:hypothetical protein